MEQRNLGLMNTVAVAVYARLLALARLGRHGRANTGRKARDKRSLQCSAGLGEAELG